jgi:CHASE3 domain sensor protein
VSRKLQYLRELTRDNPKQQEMCSRLEDVTARRIALIRESIELKQETPGSEQRLQAEFARKNLPLSNEMTSIVRQMREEEQQLLNVGKRQPIAFLLPPLSLCQSPSSWPFCCSSSSTGFFP